MSYNKMGMTDGIVSDQMLIFYSVYNINFSGPGTGLWNLTM